MYLACLLETPPPAPLLGSGAIHLLTPSKWAHLDTAAECWILMEWCSRSWVHKLFIHWYCCRVSVSVSMLGTIRSWAVENPIRISTRHPLSIHRLTPDLLQTWLGISDSVYLYFYLERRYHKQNSIFADFHFHSWWISWSKTATFIQKERFSVELVVYLVLRTLGGWYSMVISLSVASEECV